MNAEEEEKVHLAKKTQWELDKIAKKQAKGKPTGSPVLCAACNRPPAWNEWVRRDPTEQEKTKGIQGDRFRRWTTDGKVEQVSRFSSPMVTVVLPDGKKTLAHMACARRRS